MDLTATPCTVWPGARAGSASGLNGVRYGVLKKDGRSYYVHRLVWRFVHGPIPAGMHVLHRCDNPPCFNVLHLFLGNPAVNARDMVEKGRHPSTRYPHLRQGERQGAAKLIDAKVREIRRLYAAGGVSQKRLAERFGVTESLIQAVIKRRRWRHVH